MTLWCVVKKMECFHPICISWLEDYWSMNVFFNFILQLSKTLRVYNITSMNDCWKDYSLLKLHTYYVHNIMSSWNYLQALFSRYLIGLIMLLSNPNRDCLKQGSRQQISNFIAHIYYINLILYLTIITNLL